MSAASKACQQLSLLEGDSAGEDGLSRSRMQVDIQQNAGRLQWNAGRRLNLVVQLPPTLTALLESDSAVQDRLSGS